LKAFKLAHKLYGQENAIIVLINDDAYQVLSDSWYLIDGMREKHGIKMITKTLIQMEEESVLKEDGTLWIWGKEVAIAYYRTGYNP